MSPIAKTHHGLAQATPSSRNRLSSTRKYEHLAPSFWAPATSREPITNKLVLSENIFQIQVAGKLRSRNRSTEKRSCYAVVTMPPEDVRAGVSNGPFLDAEDEYEYEYDQNETEVRQSSSEIRE